MILDKNGRKFSKQIKDAKAIVLVSTDGEWWEPVMPYNVPDCIKEPDIMAAMLSGEIIETSRKQFYMAEKTN